MPTLQSTSSFSIPVNNNDWYLDNVQELKNIMILDNLMKEDFNVAYAFMTSSHYTGQEYTVVGYKRQYE